ncbi:MAG: hypothetical protein GY898_28150 [Proteobacteria bacterium]|nr:hypothetical protein [Pseudomonadota bacterium]
MCASSPLLLLLLTLLLPGLAVAAEPTPLDLALEADAVNQEHCAELYSAQVEQAASSTLAVAEVWGRLSEVYEESKAPYLLYWRGVLAQCLGRDDAAREDLEAFVASQEGQTMFEDLVRKAKVRLRRLGGANRIGQGAAAEFLRNDPVLEVELSYAAGSGVHELSCTTAVEGAINGRCAGTNSWIPHTAAAAALVGVTARVDAFPSRAFGVGARFALDAAPTGGISGHPPEPALFVAVGPHLRILNSVSSGARAGWFRIELRAAASFTRLAPVVGLNQFIAAQGFLDGGIWSLQHLGPAAHIGGALAVSPGTLLVLGGHVAWFVPGGAPWAVRTVDGAAREIHWERTTDPDGNSATRDESVPEVPTLVRSSQLRAGLRVGLLFPTKTRAAALGPVLSVDLNRAALVFDEDEGFQWCARSGCTTNELRKVYSTQRHDVLVRLGLELRFGVLRPD